MNHYIVVNLKNLDVALNQLVISVEKELTPTIKELIYQTILEAGKEEQKEWIKNVQKALSDPLPSNMLHKKRYPRSRPYPYLVSGELKNSVQAKLTKNGSVFTWWFGLMSPHAIYTNEAFRAKDTPAWKGWADRVFKSSEDLNVPSAEGIILNFFAYKLERILKGKV